MPLLISLAKMCSFWNTGISTLSHRIVSLPSAFFALIGFGLINPVLIAGALTNFKSMAGRAGALFGLISLTVGAGAMFLLGALDDGTARPMAAALGFGGGLAALAYLFLMRPLGLSGEASKS